MFLRQLFEAIDRTGEGSTAVIGWGRGMGHKGHMMLASSVITHAKELGGDPYFVVSRTYGPDDPLQPEEKLAIYRKVFPEKGHIFQTATDELPDLTRVLTDLNNQGYKNAVVVVGADQKAAFQYLNAYNGKPNKKGEVPFNFDSLNVISRQETGDPSAGEEGPRATPMRQVLTDPGKSEEEQFAVWRDAMSPEIGDDEVRDLMQKAKTRMGQMASAKPVKKDKKAVAEGTSIESTLRAVINDIGEPITNVYDTMKFQAKKYMENHGELDRGFRMVAAGIGGRWVQSMYVGRLQNELYDLCKYNTRRTVELKQFLRGIETDGELEIKRSFGSIANELPRILAKLGQHLGAAQLTKNANRWMQNKAAYEEYIANLELEDDYDEPAVAKSPKNPAIGQQRSQVEDIVNDVLSKLPKKIAGDIRNAIARSPNKLQALQAELKKHGQKSVAENKLGNAIPWPEIVNKVSSAMKAMGWKGQRQSDDAFMFSTKGQETDDQWYFVVIESEGNDFFSYALGTVEDGDPHIDDAYKGRLPNTEASISELMNEIRDGYGLDESVQSLEYSLNELSNDLLGRYKKAAGADASRSDKQGDFERGNKRFKGINKATIKQFDNDAKKATEDAAGVGIITKQNTTNDVNKSTPGKNLRAFRLVK